MGVSALKEIISNTLRAITREELDRLDFRDKYPDLLTSIETCQILKVSLQTLDTWTKEGTL